MGERLGDASSLRRRVRVSTLNGMSRIEFDDRTTETPEVAARRHVEDVARVIMGTTVAASHGVPAVGIAALIIALGRGAARTGASLDDVVQAIKTVYAAAVEPSELETTAPVSDVKH